MDSLRAFAMGQATRDRELRVFDWVKAARLIRERQPDEAEAGLAEDWFWTGGTIYRDAAPVSADDTYVFLASTWATPQLRLGDQSVDCWLPQSQTPGWDSGTYWPDEAIAELAADFTALLGDLDETPDAGDR